MIEFIEKTHTYLVDGVIVPSVSAILHSIFPDKYKNINKNILEKKAQYGTTIHEYIECLEKMQSVMPKLNFEQELSIRQYRRLKAKFELEVITQEQMVEYNGRYAGRFDMIANVKGKLSLCDIKTTSVLDKEYLSYQLSFYELAYGKKFKKLYAIWLPKKDLGKIIEIKRKTKKELLARLKNYENNIKTS
jgi:hypothetical protein